jgi:hypothetical protein
LKKIRRLINLQRRNVLDAIANSSSTSDITWIFTDSQSSDKTGAASALDYQDAARKRGSHFVSVILQCNLEENIKRLQAHERGGAVNTKLTDSSILLAIRETEDIFHFGGAHEIELDTTGLTPQETAQKVLEFLDKSAST